MIVKNTKINMRVMIMMVMTIVILLIMMEMITTVMRMIRRTQSLRQTSSVRRLEESPHHLKYGPAK